MTHSTTENSREIILDTETTGLDFDKDRIIELAATELKNGDPTGERLELRFNPDITISTEATEIHGITNEDLKDKPRFGESVDTILSFIKDATLVIHNASFDIGMINSELSRLDRPALSNPVVDTLAMARSSKELQGQSHSLDALCEYYRIDVSKREKHSASVDIDLLYEVYRRLRRGEQEEFNLKKNVISPPPDVQKGGNGIIKKATTEEIARHRQFLSSFIK